MTTNTSRKNTMKKITATLAAPTGHIDRTLATASWWDRYTLLPGTYEVELTTVSHGKLHGGFDGQAYWATVRVDAILEESYRVNTLFTASSSERTEPQERTTKGFQFYAYQMKDGYEAFGLVFHVEEDDRCSRCADHPGWAHADERRRCEHGA
jgi:hypothetical protein